MLLTVIIPSYNYAEYIGQAIESVLNQSFNDFELLIIDDGSSDASPEIIKKYAASDSRIRWFRHEVNRGIFAIFQDYLKEARGQYIHFFSADDYYLPGFLSKSMQFLLSHPQMNLCCTDMSYQSDTGNQEIKLLQRTHPVFFDPSSIMHLFRETEFRIPGVSCIVKKEMFKYGNLIQPLENISDWFFFHKIALFEGIGYIPETLITMRLHAKTYTATVKRNKKRKKRTYWSLLQHLSEKQNQEVRNRFKRSSLLTFIFEDMFWKLIFVPRYWDFFPWLMLKTSNRSKKLRGLMIRLLSYRTR